MKKVIYGFGGMAAVSISMGALFSMMHWPGAAIIRTIGFLLFILTSLVAFGSIGSNKQLNLRIISGGVAAFLISLGSIFKTFSYPSANVQIVLGACIFSFVFIPVFCYQLYKQSAA